MPGLSTGAGLQLFVGTESTDRFFAWTIQPPLTAAFLGAMYLGALVLTAFAAREKAWANARVSFAASICLVPLLFMVTLVHLDRFHTDSDDAVTLVGTWIFITTYGWLPLLLVAALVAQLRAPGVDPLRSAPLAAWMRATLAAHAVLLCGLTRPLPSRATRVRQTGRIPLPGQSSRCSRVCSLSERSVCSRSAQRADGIEPPFKALVTVEVTAPDRGRCLGRHAAPSSRISNPLAAASRGVLKQS